MNEHRPKCTNGLSARPSIPTSSSPGRSEVMGGRARSRTWAPSSSSTDRREQASWRWWHTSRPPQFLAPTSRAGPFGDDLPPCLPLGVVEVDGDEALALGLVVGDHEERGADVGRHRRLAREPGHQGP